MKIKTKIGVVGAGSWGTAIALLLASKGFSINLWGHDSKHVTALEEERENRKYLPGYTLPDNIHPTADLKNAVIGCSTVCMVVPSHGFRYVYAECVDYIEENTTVVSAVKGIENETLMTMSQVMEDINVTCGRDSDISLAVLSGPSFAKEVADKIPTAVTIGCSDIDKAIDLQNIFGTDYFRVYASKDLIGLEISAALKNIVAIAAGICDGLGYGLNTRAALITRGLAEITRLGVAMNADPATFSGLSGLGDLVLTCTGNLSRNRTVGLKLGKGKSLNQILEEMDMVAEGIKTTKSVYNLARNMNIEMPILEQVYQIIYENKDCSEAVKDLLQRELKIE